MYLCQPRPGIKESDYAAEVCFPHIMDQTALLPSDVLQVTSLFVFSRCLSNRRHPPLLSFLSPTKGTLPMQQLLPSRLVGYCCWPILKVGSTLFDQSVHAHKRFVTRSILALELSITSWLVLVGDKYCISSSTSFHSSSTSNSLEFGFHFRRNPYNYGPELEQA